MMHGSRFSRDHGDLKTPFLAGKERELLESKKWPACFSQSVDITKVQIDAFKPWISRRVTELMGVEDEIVVEYCLSQLKFLGETDAKANAENAGDGGKVLNEKPYLDPKKLQINLTGFMAKNARVFVKELWDLLLAAQDSEHGMPQSFIDEKKRELAANQQRRHERVSSPPPVEPSGTRADLAHDHSGERDASPKVERHPRDASRSRAWYETRKYDNSRRQRYRGTRRDGSYRDRGYTRRRRRSYSSSRSRSSSASYRRTLRRRSVFTYNIQLHFTSQHII
uniref:PWI domain containing protein n=1 Tax=Babesia bovis TaxID=5865 RepID=S6BKZ1_BABBO|nr:PWI domain containing protein [Babesia bovis]